MQEMEQKVEALVRLCMARGLQEEGKAKRELARLVGDGIYGADRNLRSRIGKILRQLGVPEHLSGYAYLVEAVLLVHGDSSYLRRVTLALYPELAEKFQTTAASVERGIRHAIETAWTRASMEAVQHYFGNSICPLKGKPVNSEFIARVAGALEGEECIC